MKNAPKLAQYDSDQFGPENRPYLKFKGDLFSAPNGSEAYQVRYDVFGCFSKVFRLIVLLRDPHFRWQGWQTLRGGSAHRSQSQSTH